MTEVTAPKTVVVAAMPESKSWTKSLGMLAPIVGVVAAVAAMFGISVAPADLDAVIAAGAICFNIVTQVLGAIGRATATKTVSAPAAAAK